jgi:hypothetical protein
MLGPGGTLPGFAGRFALLAGGLGAEEQTERTVRQAHVRTGLGVAFRGPFRRGFRELGETQTLPVLLVCGDMCGGDVGLGGVFWTERGDARDGGIVADGALFRGVVEGGGRL